MNHTDVVAAVKAELERRGVNLSGACGALQITKRVAWKLRDEGAGLLDKPGGNNCDGFSVDCICYPSGQLFDILVDGGGANGPTWNEIERVDGSRWRAVKEDPDGGVTPPVEPPPTTEPDVSLEYLAAIASIGMDLEDLSEQGSEMRGTIHVINESIARLAQDVAALKANKAPEYVTSFFGSQIVLRPRQ